MADADYRTAAACARCGERVGSDVGSTCAACTELIERARVQAEWKAEEDRGERRGRTRTARLWGSILGSFLLGIAVATPISYLFDGKETSYFVWCGVWFVVMFVTASILHRKYVRNPSP